MPKNKTYIILYSILTLLLTIGGNGIFSQGVNNNGALIKIESGTIMHIGKNGNGNYLNTTKITDGRIDLNGTIEVEGNWTNNASNNVFVNIGTDGTVKLIGTTQQNIGGSNWTDFENLTLNNSAGAKITVNNNRVNGTLTLTNGALTLNSNTLIINNILASSISYTNGYIISETTPATGYGILQWNIGSGMNTGTPHTVPFSSTGGTGLAVTFDIYSCGVPATGYVNFATYPTNIANSPLPGNPYLILNLNDDGGSNSANDYYDRFWIIDVENYATTLPFVNLTLKYDPSAPYIPSGNITSENDLIGAQYFDFAPGSDLWVPGPPGESIGSVNTGSHTVTISSLEPEFDNGRVWALKKADTPLPIELLSFNANCDDNKINLKWTTTTETNNDYFTIEKSKELQNWDILTEIKGAGNSNNIINYSYFDENSLTETTYYRLKQTDYDGSSFYYDAISARCYINENNFDITSISFDIENNLIINFNSENAGLYYLDLYDETGKQLLTEKYEANTGNNILSCDFNSFTMGLYMFTIYNSSKFITKKILKF